MLATLKNVIHVIQGQIIFHQRIPGDWIIRSNMGKPDGTVLKAGALFSGAGISFLAIPSEIYVFADPLFEKVIYNLIDNSIRDGMHVSRICLSVRINGDYAEIIYG